MAATAEGKHAAPSRHQQPWILGLLVLAMLFAALRGIDLLAHQPLIGLANNYDMIRVQACIQAYPIRTEAIPPEANSWQAPIERYRFVEGIAAPCFPSSEALFAWLAWPALKLESANSKDGGFSLRWIGAVKLAVMLALIGGIGWALWRGGHTWATLTHALLAPGLLLDPAITLYLNSMYAEFAAFLFGYAALALSFIALLQERTSWRLLACCFVAVILACVSKIQHAGFGIFLVAAVLLASGPRAWRQRRALLCTLALAALSGAAHQAWLIHSAQAEGIRRANLTNTVLQGVIGHSEQPHRTAQRLGLPRHCGEHGGKTWLDDEVRSAHPCPELFEMSRLRLLGLAAQEPTTLAKVLFAGIGQSRPWIPDFLGKVAGESSAPLPADFFSWDRPLSALPAWLYQGLWLGLPGLLVWHALRRRSAPTDPAIRFVLLFLAAYPWFALTVVVFGDGLADVGKQFHLGMCALLGFWLLIALRAILALGRRFATWRPSQHRSPA